MQFIIFMACLVGLRLAELVVAKRNEVWLRANGAVEYGQKHYPVIVALHTGFILSLIAEYYYRAPEETNLVLLAVFIALILIKVYVIGTLGKYWNTKILHIHGVPLVRKGLYKYIKHPNYIIVICEIAIIPLIFQLYYTAIIFSLLNALMLNIRIREENKILGKD